MTKQHWIDRANVVLQCKDYSLIALHKNAGNKVGFAFISTHLDLHDKCIQHIKEYNYEILHSVNRREAFSVDGLIVAKSRLYHKHIPNFKLHKRNSQ